MGSGREQDAMAAPEDGMGSDQTNVTRGMSEQGMGAGGIDRSGQNEQNMGGGGRDAGGFGDRGEGMGHGQADSGLDREMETGRRQGESLDASNNEYGMGSGRPKNEEGMGIIPGTGHKEHGKQEGGGESKISKIKDKLFSK